VPLLMGDFAAVAQTLNRAPSLSGRTDIWEAVITTVPNSIVGAGFESYWISPHVLAFRQTLLDRGYFPQLVENLNEAHNGYIEVYLNLGWIGICLIALVLMGGYRCAMKAYQYQPELATLFLAYIASAVFYSITEAGFRMLNPSWTFLILAILGSTGIPVGLVQTQNSRCITSPTANSSRTAALSARASRCRSEREVRRPLRTK
jgi:O-antigen ligase